jgi:hypothetical protein
MHLDRHGRGQGVYRMGRARRHPKFRCGRIQVTTQARTQTGRLRPFPGLHRSVPQPARLPNWSPRTRGRIRHYLGRSCHVLPSISRQISCITGPEERSPHKFFQTSLGLVQILEFFYA